ncbi:MAG: SMP-30/gluconolactonase/LRE family protein [Akkermansiaceae bacterium]
MKTSAILSLGVLLLGYVGAQADITTIVSAKEKVKQLATGMKFTEGPVWLPEKEMVVFSDIPNSMLMKWTEKGGLEKFRKVEHANGNILDAEGRLLTCQHSGRNVVRAEKDGTIKVLVDKHEGKKFNSPNDLALCKDGSIWFTDPSYGLRGQPGEIPGKWVFRLDAKTGKTSIIYKDFDMPNGIVFSPDYRTVYISDTGKVGVVRAFRVAGEAIDQKPLFELPVRCDGMCVDTEGNIYTTSKGGVHVFDAAGKKIGVIKTPEHPANVCFGGKGFDTLYITARKSLYSVKTKMVGMR